MSSNVGCPRSVDSLPSAAISVTPWRCAKLTARWVASMIVRCCACSSGESAGLFAQLNSHGSMKKRHVDHVDADVARVGERVDGRLEEEEARVLAGADVHDVDLRGDAGHPEAVERRADRAGHVRAVAVVVLVGGVDAARVLTRAVVDAGLGVVGREVAAQAAVEVRRDVGVRCRRRPCR